ncbi:MarR family transcriptional regulator [Halobellus rarus]|uniref:MarR family transcriptional regulator n=1 Tax=Halobellus rarus TaxID=1126237 RepID=A0ABD6CU84_9EURY
MNSHRNDGPFPVKPGTDEYAVISFFVRNRGEKFTSLEVASVLDISEKRASGVSDRLVEREFLNRAKEGYYVDSKQAKTLQHRLMSVDSAEILHNTAPDDIYTEEGWKDELDSR